MKERIKTFRGENLKNLEDEANRWLGESEKEFIGVSIATDFETIFEKRPERLSTVKGVRRVVKGYTVVYIILITYR